MHTSKIAHISDLHFGCHDEAASAALKQSLLGIRPDFLAVTGDLSEHGSSGELKQALTFLVEIKADLEMRGQPCHLLVVPGNHDLSFFSRSHGPWNAALTAQESQVRPQVNENLLAFYAEKYKDQKLASSRAKAAASLCEYFPEHGLAFLKFDSTLESRLLTNIARGHVGHKQILEMRGIIAEYQEACGASFRRSRKIALLHHHIQYLPHTEADSLLLLKDAGDFWLAMLNLDVELILHGHKHSSAQLVLRHYQKGRARELAILAAGAATAKSRPKNQPCSYYLISPQPFKFIVDQYTLLSESFSEDGYPSISYLRQPEFLVPQKADAPPIDVGALSLILNAEDHELDDIHRYTLISLTAEINDTCDYSGRYRFDGINDASSPSLRLTIPLVVVGAPKITQLAISVVDLLTGLPLERDVKATGINKLNVDLYFSAALAQGMSFSVEMRFHLTNVMYQVNDYDAFGLSRFRRGVEKFEYHFRSVYDVIGPGLYSVNADGISDDLGVLQESQDGLHFCFDGEVQKPAVLGVLFHYARLASLASGH